MSPVRPKLLDRGAVRFRQALWPASRSQPWASEAPRAQQYHRNGPAKAGPLFRRASGQARIPQAAVRRIRSAVGPVRRTAMPVPAALLPMRIWPDRPPHRQPSARSGLHASDRVTAPVARCSTNVRMAMVPSRVRLSGAASGARVCSMICADGRLISVGISMLSFSFLKSANPLALAKGLFGD